MKYYCKELSVNEKVRMTAGEKARDDLDVIIETLGYQKLPVYYDDAEMITSNGVISKIKKQIYIYKSLKSSYSHLKQGDSLFLQFPLKQTTILYDLLIYRLRAKNIHTIVLLHDIQSLRHGKLPSTAVSRKIKMKLTELTVLQDADKVIVHNEYMAQHLSEMDITKRKTISLGLFDYLIPNFDSTRRIGKTGKDKPVIIAGNLRMKKAGYVYHLPDNCFFNLYGVDYTGETTDNIKYFGAFHPDELPYELEGSFGLVWDGNVAETCSGVFGDYLKINCPHKTSLYLACGIPVAIWSKAALADFILKNKVGIVVNSLYDLHDAIRNLSEEEYAEMVNNAEKIGAKLRAGEYTKTAIELCQNH